MNGVESKAPVMDESSATPAELPRPSKARRIARIACKSLLWLFAVFVVLTIVTIFLPAVFGVFFIEIPFLLVFGWIGFLVDIVEMAEVNLVLLIEGAIVLAVLAVGGHWFARWLYSALVPAATEPWQARWTAGGLGLVLLLFVAGIATIGLSHQTAWLFMRTDPIISDGFTVREKVRMGLHYSYPHRTAVAIECNEGTMTGGVDQTRLGLRAPGVYDDGRAVRSVTLRVIDDVTATVTVVYREVRPAIPDGATLIFAGTCRNGDIIWSVGGTVPERYRPRL